MQDIQDHCVFITGGASGIGFGMARAFAEAGMTIALADIDEPALAVAASDLRARGATVETILLQVADAEAWPPAVDRAEAALGPVRVLCCNAGVGGVPSPVERIAAADWRRVFSINCDGTFYGVRTVVPRLRAAGLSGHVVLTASTAAFHAAHGSGAYSAAKAAVWSLGESLRLELDGSGIGVSVLFPGSTRTNFVANTARAIGNSAGSGSGIKSALANGMDPDLVGHAVCRAVRGNRFHILTHPAWKKWAEERFADLLAAFPDEAEGGFVEDVATLMQAAEARLKAQLEKH